MEVRTDRVTRERWIRLLSAMGSSLLLACSGARALPAPAPTKLEIEAGAGTLGQAEARCVRCGSWLRLRLRSDCTTRGKLWITPRSGDPTASNWVGTLEAHDVILAADAWQSVVFDLPTNMPGEVTTLSLNVRAHCVSEGEVLLLKEGDVKCRL